MNSHVLPPSRLRPVTPVLAVARGLTVAHPRRARPPLASAASAFGAGQARTSLGSAVAPFGHAPGAALPPPRADLPDNRRPAAFAASEAAPDGHGRLAVPLPGTALPRGLVAPGTWATYPARAPRTDTTRRTRQRITGAVA